MGRYYSGDISGKFWFAVQSCDEASFFGGEEIEPNYLEYYFDGSHKQAIDDGIRRCMEKLGERKEKLDAYFRGRSLYAADQLAEAMGVTAGELDDLLVRPPRTRREDTEVRGGKREMLLRGGTLK